MRYLLIIFIILQQPLFSQILISSNKSGMILDEIEESDKGQFYIIKTEDEGNWEKEFKYFDRDNLNKITTEYYSTNFEILNKKIVVENDKREVEIYINRRLSTMESYIGELLVRRSTYSYNDSGKLSKLQMFDGDNKLTYNEYYYRNIDGSLRKILRDSNDGYYLHWFYKDGVILESWLVEGDRSTRTQYNPSGTFKRVIIYTLEEITSTENFIYNLEGIIEKSVKEWDSNKVVKNFDSSGLITEMNEFNNDILIKKSSYYYSDKLLSRKVITGHGKREEFLYFRDDEDKVSETTHIINGVINQRNIIEKENEIFEYYRNGVIYLKEYFINGEKIRRELFLDGELFKGENFNE